MTTTDQLTSTDSYVEIDTCCAEAEIAGITSPIGIVLASGRRVVRLNVELGVTSCDTLETKVTASHLDLDLDQAEQLAWQILTRCRDIAKA